MQISNNTLLVIGISAFLVWYFFLNKKQQAESNYRGGWKCPNGYYRGPCVSNGHWGCCLESLESNYGPMAPSCPGDCQFDKRTWRCVCGSKVSL